VTARLSVDFKRPVHVGRPIRAEGWVTKERRRLVSTAASIVDPSDGTLLATAEAVYLAATEERKLELQARYGFRAGSDVPGSEVGR
jgi:acyl-CoA thioesterase FadM